MALPSFSLTGKASLIATNVSQSVALSTTGSPTTVIATNMGDYPVYVLLGTTAPTVTSANGIPIPPGGNRVLTLGSNVFAAAIGNGPIDFALGV